MGARPDRVGHRRDALLWGIAVRDAFPDHFLDWHIAAFAARHDQGCQDRQGRSARRDRDVGRARRRRGRGRGRVGPPAQGARRGAHRGRPALARVRRPDLHRRRARRVRAAHGPRPTPTTSTACSTSSSGPTSTSSSTPASPAERTPRGPLRTAGGPQPRSLRAVRMSDTEAIMWAVEKDPALRSDFCNLTILEHAARRRPHGAHGRPRASPRSPASVNASWAHRCGIVPPEFADDPTFDLERARAPHGSARSRAATATSSTSAARSPSSHSTAPARCGSSRSSKASPTGAPRCCRRCTTRSPTASAGCGCRSRSSTSSPTGRPTSRLAVANLDSHRDAGNPLDATRTAVIDAATRAASGWPRRAFGDAHGPDHPSELPGRAADTAASFGHCNARCSIPSPPAPT